jgi:integrase
VLSDTELGAIWRCTFRATLPTWYARVVRLLVLTGCRRSEIAGAHWEWIRGDWLEIPGERFKTGRVHQVHLTAMARAEMPAPAGEAGAIFGRPTNWGRYKRALDRACGVAGWTLHDVRRSVASGLQRLGERPEVIEAVLGHVIPGVAGIYRRHDFRDERRVALEVWNAHVASIVA